MKGAKFFGWSDPGLRLGVGDGGLGAEVITGREAVGFSADSGF